MVRCKFHFNLSFRAPFLWAGSLRMKILRTLSRDGISCFAQRTTLQPYIGPCHAGTRPVWPRPGVGASRQPQEWRQLAAENPQAPVERQEAGDSQRQAGRVICSDERPNLLQALDTESSLRNPHRSIQYLAVSHPFSQPTLRLREPSQIVGWDRPRMIPGGPVKRHNSHP